MFLGDIDGQIGIIGMDMREANLYIVALALFCLDSHAIWRGTPDMVAELLHTIDIKLEMTTCIDIHYIFARLLGCKDGLILGREVFELNARGEVVHAKGGNSQRRSIILCCDGLALHTTVVPERTLHTFLTLETALRSHQTLHHLVVGQVTTCSIEQFLRLGFDTVEDGDGMVGRAVVVTPHHRHIVSIRTNHGNLLLFVQWQNIVFILQQHHRLTGHIQREVG